MPGWNCYFFRSSCLVVVLGLGEAFPGGVVSAKSLPALEEFDLHKQKVEGVLIVRVG